MPFCKDENIIPYQYIIVNGIKKSYLCQKFEGEECTQEYMYICKAVKVHSCTVAQALTC